MYHQPPIIKVLYIHSRKHRINIGMKCHWLQEFNTQLKFCQHLKISLKHLKVNKHKAKPASCQAAWYLGSSTRCECLGKTHPTSQHRPARLSCKLLWTLVKQRGCSAMPDGARLRHRVNPKVQPARVGSASLNRLFHRLGYLPHPLTGDLWMGWGPAERCSGSSTDSPVTANTS